MGFAKLHCEEKHSQKSKKALQSTFLYYLKSTAKDPSISEELKDSITNIIKESENKGIIKYFFSSYFFAPNT
jgi:hypothetical protein